MNLLELRTKTRYYLDDTSSVRWKPAEVDSYINQAYRHYYNRLVNAHYNGLLATPVLLDITASVATVALPSDFDKAKIIYRVFDTYKVPLPFKGNYESTQYTGSGLGSGIGYVPNYDFLGMNLVLDPQPDTSITNALELVYWPTMTELTDVSHSPVAGFTASWHELLCLRAAIIAKSNREEEDVTNIGQMLINEEQPFSDMLINMSTARQFVEPFCTGGY